MPVSNNQGHERMSETPEIRSVPVSPNPVRSAIPSPPLPCPPSQLHSPSLTRSPLLPVVETIQGEKTEMSDNDGHRKSPFRISLTPRFMTPLASPVRKALRMTKLDPQDAWLPITESRKGNAYYAAFHTLCSGIGVQALVLPVAFTFLGWTWGIICLTLGFTWQLYTLWLLVNLHESNDTGMRYSRYLQLFEATFGERIGKVVALFPVMYLSLGTCVALIIIGGSTAKLFYQIMCAETCTAKPLTMVEWYLVFTTIAVVLSQLPSLNSIAGVSLIGALTAIGYCTVIWTISVAKGRLPGVSYDPVRRNDEVGRIFGVFNAVGIVAFAFRGHNLILEIQATMPSSEKHPSHIPMWRGVKFAYLLIALCLFPLAIGGYWAYGHLIPANGMLTALYAFHSKDSSRFVLGLTSLLVIVSSVSSFQIYGMPMFDFVEWKVYTERKKRRCPWWIRSLLRTGLGYLCFFVAVAIPFLETLAGLVGGMALPVTLAYPCFMWVRIRKPNRYGAMWWMNWVLGGLGMALSGVLIAASTYILVDTGIELSFFHPQ